MDPVTITFKKNKETKGTFRYESPEADISGSLYIKKPKVTELGSPDTIKVTIEVE